MESVEGQDKGKIVVYALSTCGWCSKTKRYLEEQGIGYSFVDVDLLSSAESKEAQKEVQRWNPRNSFPTTVVNDQVAITGYDTKKLMEAIG
ncbi:MAG: glutaredoxin family protein [Negativicutes bacterium]|nr:glutaredoxin family protein [Negativicutes bacterium]